MKSKGPRWALLPAPSLVSFADSRPFLVASRGNLESRRTQGGGFRGAPGGSLPHILSECPAPGHHLCGNNPPRIVLTQGTRRLRRTVGPPSSGALSVGTVLRSSSAGRNARASTAPGTCSFKDMEASSALSMSSSEDSLGPHCAGEETLAATRREPRSAYAQARNALLVLLSIVSRSFHPVGLLPALFDGWAAASLSLKSMRLSHKWLRLQV